MAVEDLPAHEFLHDGHGDPNHPDAICLATVVTATHETHGYGFVTQCGHTRKEHGI